VQQDFLLLSVQQEEWLFFDLAQQEE